MEFVELGEYFVKALWMVVLGPYCVQCALVQLVGLDAHTAFVEDGESDEVGIRSLVDVRSGVDVERVRKFADEWYLASDAISSPVNG